MKIRMTVIAIIGMSLGVSAQDNKIESSGNVGIGTKSPKAKLDVRNGHLYVGDENFSNPGSWGQTINIDDNVHSRILIEERATGVKTSLWAHTGGNAKVGTISNHDFGIITNGTDKLTVKTNGYIGIGTKSPDSKLTVAGNIHSREVKVTINAGADFVFEKEYKLPTLESIEKYIEINKHLPEIASEKEMKKNGLLLAEMNIKLLQKIEELTLYTIKQEKRLNNIDLKNKRIEKENKVLKSLAKRLTKIEEQLKKKN
jgi:hypothetical protein